MVGIQKNEPCNDNPMSLPPENRKEMNHLPTWLIFRAVNSLVLSSFQGGFFVTVDSIKKSSDHQGCFFSNLPIRNQESFSTNLDCFSGVSLRQQCEQYVALPSIKLGHMSLLRLPPIVSCLFPHNGFPTTFSAKFVQSQPRVAQRKRSVKQMMYNTPGQGQALWVFNSWKRNIQ